MNKQEAQMVAARETLRAAIKESRYTVKEVARLVGEEYTTFSKRLHGNVAGYQQLDTALVVNVLAILEVPLPVFFTRVERRAEELLRRQQ